MNKVKIKKIIAERLILFLNMCENQQATYGFQPKWKAITPLVKHTQKLYDEIPSKSKNILEYNFGIIFCLSNIPVTQFYQPMIQLHDCLILAFLLSLLSTHHH